MAEQDESRPESQGVGGDVPLVLAYASPPPWYRRRVWVKLFVTLVALIVVLFAVRSSLRMAAVVQRNGHIDRAQEQMLTFAQPASTVVYEENQASCDELLASGTGYFTQQGLDGREVAAWGRIVFLNIPRGFPADARIDYLGDASLFLHRRVSPAGNERIVSLGDPSIFDFCRHYRQVCFVFGVGKPATTSGALPVFDSFGPHTLSLRGNERLRMFAGQPDKADLSHWTIAYELNGQAGTIDGYLLDDDRISLKVRDGPLIDRILKLPISTPARPKCPLDHGGRGLVE